MWKRKVLHIKNIPLQTPFKAFDYVVKTRTRVWDVAENTPNGCRINSQKCPAKEGLARTLKKGLKQSFLTDSGKAQSSEMVRFEESFNRKKAYLFYSKTLLG